MFYHDFHVVFVKCGRTFQGRISPSWSANYLRESISLCCAISNLLNAIYGAVPLKKYNKSESKQRVIVKKNPVKYFIRQKFDVTALLD